jgi:tocopherol cyclase
MGTSTSPSAQRGPYLVVLVAIALGIIYTTCYLPFRTHWKLIFHSDRYHGPPANHRSFIEGWYYKMVSADEQYSIAIVPGIFYGNTSADGDHHAFIFLNVQSKFHNLSTDLYYRYDVSALQSSSTDADFNVTVHKTNFGLQWIHIDVDNQHNAVEKNEFGNATVRADLRFTDMVPWPTSTAFPSIMGPLQYLPFLNCYHGLLSMNHEIHGHMILQDESGTVHDIDMNGGKGYIEKDYGTAFPSTWIWMQTNHFHQENVSLFVAVADVPIIASLNIRMPMGIIGGIYIDGTFYEFSSYQLSSIRDLRITEEELSFVLYSKRWLGGGYELHIYVNRTEADSSNILFAPCGRTMCKYVPEALNANIHVRLIDVREPGESNRKVIFEGVGRNAGLEIVRDVLANFEVYKRLTYPFF